MTGFFYSHIWNVNLTNQSLNNIQDKVSHVNTVNWDDALHSMNWNHRLTSQILSLIITKAY